MAAGPALQGPLNSLNVSCSPNNRRESICSSVAGCETASGGLKHKKFNEYTFDHPTIHLVAAGPALWGG